MFSVLFYGTFVLIFVRHKIAIFQHSEKFCVRLRGSEFIYGGLGHLYSTVAMAMDSHQSEDHLDLFRLFHAIYRRF